MENHETRPVYSVRKEGRIYAQSHEPNCGYSSQILRQMQKAGYYLYKDGKRVKIGGKADG